MEGIVLLGVLILVAIIGWVIYVTVKLSTISSQLSQLSFTIVRILEDFTASNGQHRDVQPDRTAGLESVGREAATQQDFGPGATFQPKYSASDASGTAGSEQEFASFTAGETGQAYAHPSGTRSFEPEVREARPEISTWDGQQGSVPVQPTPLLDRSIPQISQPVEELVGQGREAGAQMPQAPEDTAIVLETMTVTEIPPADSLEPGVPEVGLAEKVVMPGETGFRAAAVEEDAPAATPLSAEETEHDSALPGKDYVWTYNGPHHPVEEEAPTAQATENMEQTPSLPPESATDGLLGHLRRFIREGNFWVAGGVLMLLLGFAFLLTYMAERGIFSIEMRIATAAATGLAMVVLGLFLRNRRQTYALIMQGGGIGVMYLAVFAAAKLTSLVGPALGLGLMTLLVIPAVALAVLQGAQVLAIFAFLGGFAAPILLSTGSGNYIALFSYYTLLNLGLIGITRFKLWRWLNLLGAFCTFVVLGYWCAASYNIAQFLTLEPFLIGFTLIFTLITLISARKADFSFRHPADAVLACAVPFVAAFLQWQMAAGLEHGLSLSALGFGAFYLFLAVFIWKRVYSRYAAAAGQNAASPDETSADKTTEAVKIGEEDETGETEDATDDTAAENSANHRSGDSNAASRFIPQGIARTWRLLAELYLACGVMLANLAVPLEFSGQITSAVWSLEGAVLFYMAFRMRSTRIKLVAMILLTVGFFACLLDMFGSYEGALGSLDAHKLISTCMTGFAFIFSACLHKHEAELRADTDSPEPMNSRSGLRIENLLAGLGLAVWFIGIALEAGVNCDQPFDFMLGAVSVSALAFCAVGARLGFRTLLLSGWLPLPFSLLCLGASLLGGVDAYFYGMDYGWLWFITSHNYFREFGWLAWLLFAVCQGLLLFGAFKNQGYVTDRKCRLALAVFSLELLFVITSSIRAVVIQSSGTPAWADLAAISPSLLYVIAMAAMASPALRSRMSPAALPAFLGSIPAALFAALGIWFGLGLFETGNPAPLPFYLPVLNPLELQQLLCVAIFAVWQTSLHGLVRQYKAESAHGDASIKTLFRSLNFWALSERRLLPVMSLLLFAWLHSVLFRSIHFFTGTPMHRVWDHPAFQTLLTALWSLWGLGHIILGNKKRTRMLWLIGAVLMLAVTIKIFMVDLADKGTLFRIISFFVLGGIFLVVGWLAPLPPARKTQDDTSADKPDDAPDGKAADARPDTHGARETFEKSDLNEENNNV